LGFFDNFKKKDEFSFSNQSSSGNLPPPPMPKTTPGGVVPPPPSPQNMNSQNNQSNQNVPQSIQNFQNAPQGQHMTKMEQNLQPEQAKVRQNLPPINTEMHRPAPQMEMQPKSFPQMKSPGENDGLFKQAPSQDLFKSAPTFMESKEKEISFSKDSFDTNPKPTTQPGALPPLSLPSELKPEGPPGELPSLFGGEKKTVVTNQRLDDIPYFNVGGNDDFDMLPLWDTENNPDYRSNKYKGIVNPLFIRTDDYTNVLTNLSAIRNRVVDSTDATRVLENLKRNADIEHKNYKMALEDIQRKIIYIDKVLFKT